MMLALNPRLSASEFEIHALPHMDSVFRIAYRYTRDRMQAEDLTQDTFTVAFEKFTQLKDITKVRGWLMAILRNLFLGTLDKEKHVAKVDFEVALETYSDPEEGRRRHERDGFSDEVKLQLDRLDDKFKAPLLMSVLEDRSYKEISDTLDIPAGTVMSRISRGKNFLRKGIERRRKVKETEERRRDRSFEAERKVA